IIDRLAQRWAADGKETDFAACAQLLKTAPNPASIRLVMTGMERALVGQKFEKIPTPLEPWLAKAWPANCNDIGYIRFALRLGSASAGKTAVNVIRDPSAAEAERATLIEVLGQTRQAESVPVLLGILEQPASDKLRATAVEALQRFPDTNIADSLVKLYPRLSLALRE